MIRNMAVSLDHLRERLFALAKDQLLLFSKQAHDLYGFGFFCDALSGDVFLVANTRGFHDESVKKLTSPAFGPSFKWDIGNWKWPAGLFPSSSNEQREFDVAWARARGAVKDLSQGALEDCCNAVLMELYNMRESPLNGVEGLIVLGPEDNENTIGQKLVLVSGGSRPGGPG